MLNQNDILAILEQVRRGNSEAFRHIVREYGLSLRSYLCSHVYHLDDVDDLLQEVFIAAFRNLPSFRPEGDLGAWLRGIARHKILGHCRSNQRRDNALDRFRAEVATVLEADLDCATRADQSRDIERLLLCISKLPDKLRRIVHAGLEGEKPTALAEALSTSVGAIYNLHYRANQLLRECVSKEMAHGT